MIFEQHSGFSVWNRLIPHQDNIISNISMNILFLFHSEIAVIIFEINFPLVFSQLNRASSNVFHAQNSIPIEFWIQIPNMKTFDIQTNSSRSLLEQSNSNGKLPVLIGWKQWIGLNMCYINLRCTSSPCCTLVVKVRTTPTSTANVKHIVHNSCCICCVNRKLQMSKWWYRNQKLRKKRLKQKIDSREFTRNNFSERWIFELFPF